MPRQMANALHKLYKLPPVALVVSCNALILIAYFVLPLAVGLPLIAIAALLPWVEEQLSR
jgi:hypothetical protein